MGFKTFGFAGGRADVWEPPEDIYWGPEDTWLGDKRYTGDRQLASPLAAVQMGLIYVNPEGPNGNPDPLGSARDIRETFARMAMNDEETVALIAGGHTFGKTHGAGRSQPMSAPSPRARMSSYRASAGRTASAPARATTPSPAAWRAPGRPTGEVGQQLLRNLFGYRLGTDQEPGGCEPVGAEGPAAAGTVPDAHDPAKRHAPFMATTDLALKVDPIYAPISKRFHENPDQFADAFARAWYKLTHRDMGPRVRYLGAEVPAEVLLWQDPIPAVDHPLIGCGGHQPR